MNNKYGGLIKDYVFAFLIFLQCQPVYIWDAYGKVSLIITVIIFFFLRPQNTLYKEQGILLFLVFLGTVFYRLNPYFSLLRFLVFISYFAFFNIRKEIINRYYNAFKNILSILLLLSIITYILTLFGFDFPYKIIDPLNELKNHGYKQYTFLIVPNTFIPSFRFHGVFDEPGVVGTLMGVILYIEKFNINDRRNLIFVISGILSFSFYFICISLIYFILISNKKIKIILIIVFSLFYITTKNNEIINEYIWERFTINSNTGKLAGINRNSVDFDEYYKKVRWTTDYFIGIGDQNINKYASSSSYKIAVLRDGALFIFIIYIYMMIYGYIYIFNKRDLLMYIILISLTLYQRPVFFDHEYIFLFAVFLIKNAHKTTISLHNRVII